FCGSGSRHTRCLSAWSSGGCSSDLAARERAAVARATAAMLRLTQREVVAATQRTAARAGGRRTAVIAVRAKARLDAPTLARVRQIGRASCSESVDVAGV